MKIRPVGVEGRREGRTEMTNLNSRFSQYCKRAYKFVGTIITNGLNAEIRSSKNFVYIRYTLDSVQ
jgi:hypothetical protein